MASSRLSSTDLLSAGRAAERYSRIDARWLALGFGLRYAGGALGPDAQTSRPTPGRAGEDLAWRRELPGRFFLRVDAARAMPRGAYFGLPPSFSFKVRRISSRLVRRAWASSFLPWASSTCAKISIA